MRERDLDHELKVMELVEKELEKQKKDAIFCLILFLCSENIWILAVAFWEKLNKPVSPEIMTIAVEVIAAIMLVFILLYTKIDIRKFGISTKRIKTPLVRASIISVIAASALVITKLLLYPGEAVFNWSLFDPLYIITTIIQEFLSRGFLVTILLTINPGKKGKQIAVICSSLIFTSLHLFYGFTFMIGAGILSIILGYIYIKDKNIWGVSLIHYVIGIVAMLTELV